MYFDLAIAPAVQGHVYMDLGFKRPVPTSPRPYLQTTLRNEMLWYRGAQSDCNHFDSFRIRGAKHWKSGEVARTETRK